jgi:hypothetical protein
MVGSDPESRRMSPAALLRRALPLLFLLGCDNSFEPIQKNDRSFSVFGHLDPSADTQWIRVMPLRSVITSPGAFRAHVALQEVGSGRALVLRDSIFEYPHNVHVGSEGVSVHNFWTTEQIRAGELYRFSAVGSNGDSASATIPIPSDYAVSVVFDTRPGVTDWRLDELRVSGVQSLAFVRVVALIRNLCSRAIKVIPYQIPAGTSDPHTVLVRKSANLTNPVECGRDIVEKRELWIVGSGSPWPAGQEFSSEALGVPQRYSVPTPAGSGDLASYLQTLPGVVTTGDRGGHLFVRGGTPAENLVLIDGIPIYQPFHILGFFSVFPEDLVSSADLYAGGFGARYHGRSSSVLDVRMRDGSRHGYRAAGSASPFVAEALIEGPLGGGFPWMASARRSLVEQTSEALLGNRQPLTFESQLFKLTSVSLPFGRMELQAGAINVYNRSNMFYYDLFTGRRVDQLPFAPYLSISLRGS